jgi:hypothetical protein
MLTACPRLTTLTTLTLRAAFPPCPRRSGGTWRPGDSSLTRRVGHLTLQRRNTTLQYGIQCYNTVDLITQRVVTLRVNATSVEY